MQNRVFLHAAFLLFAFVAVACSSNLCKVDVITIPPGASVTLDGKSQSDSPCTVTFEKNEDIDVTHYLYITKPGYQNVRKIFKQSDYTSTIEVILDKE